MRSGRLRRLPRSPVAMLLGALGVLAAALGFPAAASGHEMGVVEVQVTFAADATYRVDVAVDPVHLESVERAGAQAPIVFADREGAERALAAFDARDRAKIETFLSEFLAGSELRFDGKAVTPRRTLHESGRVAVARLEGAIPPAVKEFQWHAAMPVGVYLVTLRNATGTEEARQWAVGGEATKPFALDAAVVPPTTAEAIKLYLLLGFTHILPKGLDHILFVLGIFLLSQRLKPVIAQVTAFTVAHTLTLGLSIYGVVSLPASIVEPLIALSIVYVAVENVVTARVSPWRIAVVFAFGLLHGLGFAGVLREIGLPRAQFLTALLSFNIGVEIGQLTVILSAFLLVGLAWRDRPWYRRRVVIPASIAIALVGLYWAVERTFG